MLISGKEAKLAWANDQDVEFYSEDLNTWFSLKDDVFLSDVFDKRKLRLKPRTITINGIECPAPFEPKDGDTFYLISDYYDCGWSTEEEIRQVVAALRSIFK